MSHHFGEAPILMALCCCLLVILSMIYPAATHQTGVDSKTKSVVVGRGLPRISMKISQQRETAGSGILSNRRILASGMCTSKDITIFQSQSGEYQSGIPQFTVQIINNCVSSCAPWDIHVACGWFASARALNPNTFQRIAYNNCVVNGGQAVKYGQILSFTYANSFRYPLSFKSASFCN